MTPPAKASTEGEVGTAGSNASSLVDGREPRKRNRPQKFLDSIEEEKNDINDKVSKKDKKKKKKKDSVQGQQGKTKKKRRGNN